MMKEVADFLTATYGMSFEETPDGAAWLIKEDNGVGNPIGTIQDVDIANITADALLNHNMDWSSSVDEVCQWVAAEQLGLPASSELDSTNVSCGTRNARVEKTAEGTFVVRGDSDRFGDDAILFEHYDEGKANEYLAKLEAMNQAENDGTFNDGILRYREYIITGNNHSYVAISPYGKWSPEVYRTVDEAKAAIDKDRALRFPERKR